MDIDQLRVIFGLRSSRVRQQVYRKPVTGVDDDVGEEVVQSQTTKHENGSYQEEDSTWRWEESPPQFSNLVEEDERGATVDRQEPKYPYKPVEKGHFNAQNAH